MTEDNKNEATKITSMRLRKSTRDAIDFFRIKDESFENCVLKILKVYKEIKKNVTTPEGPVTSLQESQATKVKNKSKFIPV